METTLERIAAKARCEPKLRFTSLAHHVTKERVWDSLCHIPNQSAPGWDKQRVAEAKEEFEVWVEPMLNAVHRKAYHPPPIRRVYIPKPERFSEAYLRCYRPSMSRIFCNAHSVDGLGIVPIRRYRRSTS